MLSTGRYAAPCMTNLPTQLGRAIFKQMLSTPKRDEDAIERKVRKLEQELIEARMRERGEWDNGIAVLSSFDDYTTFSFRGKKLTFRTCNGLERYTKVLLWKNGCIEVTAKYKENADEIDKYIDLTPILDELYMDREEFLSPINGVKIEYV